MSRCRHRPQHKKTNLQPHGFTAHASWPVCGVLGNTAHTYIRLRLHASSYRHPRAESITPFDPKTERCVQQVDLAWPRPVIQLALAHHYDDARHNYAWKMVWEDRSRRRISLSSCLASSFSRPPHRSTCRYSNGRRARGAFVVRFYTSIAERTHHGPHRLQVRIPTLRAYREGTRGFSRD